MSYVAGNADPYAGDTSQKHESHTATPTVAQYISAFVPPAPGVQPSTFGFKAWTFDPLNINSNGQVTSGWTSYGRVDYPSTFTTSNVYFYCVSAGTALTDFTVAIYDSAGTLKGSTTGQQGLLSATSMITVSLAVALTGSFCYVAFAASGTTGPQLGTYSQPSLGINKIATTAIGVRAGAFSTYPPPASFTPTSVTTTFPGYPWIGIA